MRYSSRNSNSYAHFVIAVAPTNQFPGTRRSERIRSGHVLPLVVIALASMLGILALVFDAGMLMDRGRDLQHVADAAATAGVMELRLGKSLAAAQATAVEYVNVRNDLPDANVETSIPPSTGAYAGLDDHLEVRLTRDRQSHFIHLVGGGDEYEIKARAVAGLKPSTEGAAIVVLDPDPHDINIPPVPALPVSLPALLGGLEILGAGQVRVNGAVLVNTTWGGVDENGDPAGVDDGPPWGIACMPVLPLTKLLATDIRVQGGVDNQDNYGHLDAGEESPLTANRLPVPDPYEGLPVPTVAADSVNVRTTTYGHQNILNPSSLVLGIPVQLQPGVYDSINIDGSYVVFQPGVYIIRGISPVTQSALSIIASRVTAQNVMFYITDSAGYDANNGDPDSSDGETDPPAQVISNFLPSVLIIGGNVLWPSSFSALQDAASPFDGLLIYQRRHDRRPVVIVDVALLSPMNYSGTIYAKWGHVLMGGRGTYNARIVAGTARLLAILDMTLAPQDLLPPAEDVYLVE